MSYYVRQISQAASEPVSLNDAKLFCRVSNTEEDALIGGLITAARKHAEDITGRCLAQRQFVLVLDRFNHLHGETFWPDLFAFNGICLNHHAIKIPYAPLKSVNSIRYIAQDGTAVTLNPDVDFIIDRISELGRIFPLHGHIWPSALHVANAIEITFTAGYDPDPDADPDDHEITGVLNQQPDSTVLLAIPETIRVAILILVAHWYSNREPVASGSVASIPNSVDALLAMNSVLDFCPTGSR
jgi:Phage gp6-like head-tail connector protein